MSATLHVGEKDKFLWRDDIKYTFFGGDHCQQHAFKKKRRKKKNFHLFFFYSLLKPQRFPTPPLFYLVVCPRPFFAHQLPWSISSFGIPGHFILLDTPQFLGLMISYLPWSLVADCICLLIPLHSPTSTCWRVPVAQVMSTSLTPFFFSVSSICMHCLHILIQSHGLTYHLYAGGIIAPNYISKSLSSIPN